MSGEAEIDSITSKCGRVGQLRTRVFCNKYGIMSKYIINDVLIISNINITFFPY